MANRTSLTQVADGDILSQGYFNEIGVFYVEAVDSGGASYTHNAASWSKERTFTFSGLSTNYQIVAIELEDVTLTDSSSNNNDYHNMGIIVKNVTGNTYHAPNGNFVSTIAGTGAPIITFPPCWDTTTDGAAIALTTLQGTATIDAITIPVPVGYLTGSTSYEVQVYLFASQTAANTVTLTNGFTVRLVLTKRAQDLGTSVSQA